ncbi:hypothetical protein [Evansella clarkii]|uniref:hypothetical protein n=1 Tax=Evansella clarkii TaxID=79879 RepID=UPI001C469EE7|nr:hypothetical protein [Evansella clarkii]
MMADYKYKGLTAYIKQNEANADRFMVLRNAVESLQSSVEERSVDMSAYGSIVGSEAYKHLYDNDSMTFAEDFELPNETPPEYARAVVERVTVKGVMLHRVYIPAVSKREESAHDFIYNALRPVLLELFGEDLIHMVMKESVEYENFKDGKETILVSVEDREAVTA